MHLIFSWFFGFKFWVIFPYFKRGQLPGSWHSAVVIIAPAANCQTFGVILLIFGLKTGFPTHSLIVTQFEDLLLIFDEMPLILKLLPHILKNGMACLQFMNFLSEIEVPWFISRLLNDIPQNFFSCRAANMHIPLTIISIHMWSKLYRTRIMLLIFRAQILILDVESCRRETGFWLSMEPMLWGTAWQNVNKCFTTLVLNVC